MNEGDIARTYQSLGSVEGIVRSGAIDLMASNGAVVVKHLNFQPIDGDRGAARIVYNKIIY